MKNPKKFSWKVTSKDKHLPGTIMCQEQCSSNGGNGRCGSAKTTTPNASPENKVHQDIVTT